MAKTLTEEQIAEKKGELIKIATEIMEKEGFQALTLRRLASDAGMSRSTPYLYFKDKKELCLAVCLETFLYLTEKCSEAIAGHEGYLEQIKALGGCYLKFGIERPVLYHLTFAPENPEDDIHPEIQAAVDAHRAMTEVPMRKAYEAGLLNYPPERLNPVLWACSHGLLCLRWAGHLSDEDAFERVQQDMEQILGMGFLNKEKLKDG